MKITSPAQKARDMGLDSLTELSNISKQSLQTLTNWNKNKKELFELVLIGALVKKIAGNRLKTFINKIKKLEIVKPQKSN